MREVHGLGAEAGGQKLIDLKPLPGFNDLIAEQHCMNPQKQGRRWFEMFLWLVLVAALAGCQTAPRPGVLEPRRGDEMVVAVGGFFPSKQCVSVSEPRLFYF